MVRGYNAAEADRYFTEPPEDYWGCEPEQVEPDSRYHSGAYNCDYCDNEECEHWKEYHDAK